MRFGKRATDYLSRNPVTGLLIAKDDQILFEHYQYGRTDRDLLISQSMVKSITGVLIGIAIAEGAIKSVDDTADTYVPGFKGTEYGKTPIRDLLHMSSGVEFGEESNGERDLNRLWIDMIATGASVPKRHHRQHYAIQPADCAARNEVFLRQHRTGRTRHRASLRDQQTGFRIICIEKVWSRIGAEADAKWLIDAQGLEVAHFGFNAVLRDYARLGRLLAHDGAWEGEQIIPAQWMIDATTVRDVGWLSATGQSDGPGAVRLWLSVVAASGRETPVRAGRRLWPSHLR